MQDKSANVVSPVNGSKNIKLIENISTEEIRQRWISEFSIDIKSEFCSVKYFSLYLCEKSALKFYCPHDIAGSSLLYEQLSQFDWYYMRDKWEFKQAEKDLIGLSRVSEIGCARGDFLQALIKKGFDVVGFEFNKKAAKAAIDKGIVVYSENLGDEDPCLNGSFDAVCSFQVLEHVAEPMVFLRNCLALLKPGGKLIITVPNGKITDTTLTNSLLDLPPHHMTRWYSQTFQLLEDYLPIQLCRITKEPLAAYHVNWFLQSLRRKIPERFGVRFIFKISLENILRIILLLGWRKFVTGHTLYICYKKL